MTLYFFKWFGGVFLALVLTFLFFDYGIDGIVALWQRLQVWRQRRTRSNVLRFDKTARYWAAVSMGRERRL